MEEQCHDTNLHVNKLNCPTSSSRKHFEDFKTPAITEPRRSVFQDLHNLSCKVMLEISSKFAGSNSGYVSSWKKLKYWNQMFQRKYIHNSVWMSVFMIKIQAWPEEYFVKIIGLETALSKRIRIVLTVGGPPSASPTIKLRWYRRGEGAFYQVPILIIKKKPIW
jgi:hypothetical protein